MKFSVAEMSSANGSTSILPKWQLALVVGAPVALGLGYMYYKSTSSSTGGTENEKKGDRLKNRGKGVRTKGEKYSSIDGDLKSSDSALANEVRF